MEILEKVMPKPFSKRIKAFMEAYNLTNSKLASDLDMKYQALHNVLSGRNYLSLVSMTMLAEKYPDLNLHWLLTGKGEMNKEVDIYKKEIKGLKKELKACKERSKLLSEMVDNQRLVIDMMKKKPS